MSLKSPARALRPDFTHEDQFDGPVCGLDEVGRGPLAGPVVAACVYIPEDKRTLEFVPQIRDSKKIAWKKLEELYSLICTHFEYGIAECSAQEIDEINILQASLLAMERAFADMRHPDRGHGRVEGSPIAEGDPSARALQDDGKDWHALIDGNRLPKSLPCPATAIVKGDSKSVSIAAASILAKVTRDRIMHKLAEEHPFYGWDTNVGYPAKRHLDGIEQNGITDHHRRSFAPVRNFITQKSVKIA